MGFLELFLIAVGLSMDAFAVSIGKGLGMRKLDVRQALVIALFFGGFQALMPVIGWVLGHFAPADRRIIDRAIDRASEFICDWCASTTEKLMNRVNSCDVSSLDGEA